MRLTSFSSTELSKNGQSTSQGILHNFTMAKTDEGVSITAELRHGGQNDLSVTFEADDYDGAWDYAEAFERGLTRELATTGIHGFIARMDYREIKLIGKAFAAFSHNGKTPDSIDRYGHLITRGKEATDGPVVRDDGRYDEPVPAELQPAMLEHLTIQADMAARDAVLAERQELHFDQAAGVIGRFLQRSGLGAVETEFDSFSGGAIHLPLLGKGTKIELCGDSRGTPIWKLHDKQLEAEHHEKYETKAYDPPQGPLNVASLYQLHQKLDVMAEQRNAGGWAYERYFTEMTRAASNMKAEANEITNPDKILVMPGEDPPKIAAEAMAPLHTKVDLGRIR